MNFDKEPKSEIFFFFVFFFFFFFLFFLGGGGGGSGQVIKEMGERESQSNYSHE